MSDHARTKNQQSELGEAAEASARPPQQLRKVANHLIQLAGRVTKSRPGQFCFQVLRRDRDDGTIEYQIFADTKGNGTQVAYVQSTRHDAEFIAACLAQASLFASLLGEASARPSPPQLPKCNCGAAIAAEMGRGEGHGAGCPLDGLPLPSPDLLKDEER